MNNHHQFFKIAAFIFALVLCGLLIYAIAATRESNRGKSDTVQQNIPVVVEPITSDAFTRKIVTQGSLEAKHKALVPAKIPGTIDSIFVDEGDPVFAGKTKLFQMDSLKLEKAVEMQRQALGVAQCALLEKETRLEQVKADLKKASTDYRRYQRLLENKAVSQDGFEQMALRHKQAQVALKHLKTLIELSMEQKRQAQTALVMAEKDLTDSLVLAPITGHVVLRLKEPGEMAGAGEPVLKIENRAIVEAVAFLPAQLYGDVQPGKTQVNLRVNDQPLENLTIDYKSPTINEKLRTFVIKSLMNHPADDFIPGAMAEMEVLLSHETGLSVESTAIQMRNNKPVIFVIKHQKALLYEITTGIENNGRTQIFSNKPLEGESVVVEGQLMLNDGTPVMVVQRNIS